MGLNNSTYTQSLGIPFTQYVTSSADHASVSSSTYFNDVSDNIPRYKDADGNILEPMVSASYAVTASYALSGGSGGGGGSTDTGSLLTTASAASNVITFTKGDASTFDVTIDTGSGGSAFPYEGDAVITGSLTISGSFNAFRVDSDDIVLGLNAGASLEAGVSRAVLIGENAGDSLTTSLYVVGIGYNAVSTGTNGITGTVAIGYRAGQNGTTGDYNTLIGYNTGQTISTGGNNTALGRDAMSSGTVTGDYNTSLGVSSGIDLTSGFRNVFVGYLAGDNNTTGFRNVYLGTSAGDSGVSGNYNIAIGDNADVSASGEHQIAIGRGVTTANDGDIRIGSGSIIPFSGSSITGDVSFPSTASAAYFVGDGSGLTGINGGDDPTVSTKIFVWFSTM